MMAINSPTARRIGAAHVASQQAAAAIVAARAAIRPCAVPCDDLGAAVATAMAALESAHRLALIAQQHCIDAGVQP